MNFPVARRVFIPTDSARPRRSAIVWASLAALLALAAAQAEAQIVVDPSPTTTCVRAATHFTTIQSAVNSAGAGRAISVCPGVYAEQITISKPLTIRGVTSPATNGGIAVVKAPGLNTMSSADGTYAAQILVTAGPVTIADIAVDGAGAFSGCGNQYILAGIEFSYAVASTGTLSRVALRNQNVPDGAGGYCQLGAGVVSQGQTSLTVQQSSIHDFDWDGITAIYATVTGNEIVGVTGLVAGQLQTPAVARACVVAGVAIGGQPGQVAGNTLSTCVNGIAMSGTTIPITGNTILNTYNAISTGGNQAGAPGLIISNNKIAGAGRGIWNDGYGDTISNNQVSNASDTAIVLTGGNRNATVTNNAINEANVGISGVTGSTLTGNAYFNVNALTTP